MALRLTVILTVAARFAVRFHKIMNYLGSFSNEIKWPQATSHSEAGSQRIRWFPANAAASFKRVINSIRARRLPCSHNLSGVEMRTWNQSSQQKADSTYKAKCTAYKNYAHLS